MFRKKYTKWIPFGNFSFQSYDYITFVRRNLKDNMLDFKTKRVNRNFRAANCVSNILPNGLIDVKEAWEEITSQSKPLNN